MGVHQIHSDKDTVDYSHSTDKEIEVGVAKFLAQNHTAGKW